MNNLTVKITLTALIAAGTAVSQTDTINVLAPYEVNQGFDLLFDGVNATSFRNNFADYTRNNTTNTNLNAGWTMSTTLTDPDRSGAFFRAMVTPTPSNFTDSRTRKLYRDMDLRLDYRNTGNQGIVYRHDVSGAYNWETGIELGIDDNTNQSGDITAGAAYDMIGPNPPASTSYRTFSTGRWNSLRLVIKGDSVEHWMNGSKVVSFRYWSPSFITAFNSSKWTAYNRFCQTAANNRIYIPQGYWGFQNDHGGQWQIRRIRVLHDSLAGQNRVTLGPVQSSVNVFSGEDGKRLGYRLERRAEGLVFVLNQATDIKTAEIYDPAGRSLRRLRSVSPFELSLDPTFRKGLYLLRLETGSGPLQAKVFIP